MRIAYINLAKRADRDQQFRRLNSGIADFERVDGIEGAAVDVDELIRTGVIQERLQYFSSGGIGCALTHRQLWQRCLVSRSVVTIAEDDAVFNRNFAAKASRLLAQLPPVWDIVLWGWNFDSILHVKILDNTNNCVMFFDGRSLRSRLPLFQDAVYDVIALHLQNAFGTVCYSVSPQGAKRLLEKCFPLRNEDIPISGLKRLVCNSNIDTAMNKCFRELHSFACFPPLVWTENDKSVSDVGDATAILPPPT